MGWQDDPVASSRGWQSDPVETGGVPIRDAKGAIIGLEINGRQHHFPPPSLSGKIARTATFGIGDKAANAVRALGDTVATGAPFGSTMGALRSMEDRAYKEFDAQHPLQGALGTAGGVVASGGTLAPETMASTLFGRTVQRGALGAGYGGLTAFGNASGTPEEQARQTGAGAAIGAVAAPVAGAVGEGAVKTGKWALHVAERLFGGNVAGAMAAAAQHMAEVGLGPSDQELAAKYTLHMLGNTPMSPEMQARWEVLLAKNFQAKQLATELSAQVGRAGGVLGQDLARRQQPQSGGWRDDPVVPGPQSNALESVLGIGPAQGAESGVRINMDTGEQKPAAAPNWIDRQVGDARNFLQKADATFSPDRGEWAGRAMEQMDRTAKNELHVAGNAIRGGRQWVGNRLVDMGEAVKPESDANLRAAIAQLPSGPSGAPNAAIEPLPEERQAITLPRPGTNQQPQPKQSLTDILNDPDHTPETYIQALGRFGVGPDAARRMTAQKFGGTLDDNVLRTNWEFGFEKSSRLKPDATDQDKREARARYEGKITEGDMRAMAPADLTASPPAGFTTMPGTTPGTKRGGFRLGVPPETVKEIDKERQAPGPTSWMNELIGVTPAAAAEQTPQQELTHRPGDRDFYRDEKGVLHLTVRPGGVTPTQDQLQPLDAQKAIQEGNPAPQFRDQYGDTAINAPAPTFEEQAAQGAADVMSAVPMVGLASKQLHDTLSNPDATPEELGSAKIGMAMALLGIMPGGGAVSKEARSFMDAPIAQRAAALTAKATELQKAGRLDDALMANWLAGDLKPAGSLTHADSPTITKPSKGLAAARAGAQGLPRPDTGIMGALKRLVGKGEPAPDFIKPGIPSGSELTFRQALLNGKLPEYQYAQDTARYEAIKKGKEIHDQLPKEKLLAASQAGYDSEVLFFHGTGRGQTESGSVKTGKNWESGVPKLTPYGDWGKGFYVSRSPGVAADYANEGLKSTEASKAAVMPLVLRKDAKILDIGNITDEQAKALIKELGLEKETGFLPDKTITGMTPKGALRWALSGGSYWGGPEERTAANAITFDKLRAAGYDALDPGGAQFIVLNSAKLRHIDAAFDPAKRNSPDIYAMKGDLTDLTTPQNLNLSALEAKSKILKDRIEAHQKDIYEMSSKLGKLWDRDRADIAVRSREAYVKDGTIIQGGFDDMSQEYKDLYRKRVETVTRKGEVEQEFHDNNRMVFAAKEHQREQAVAGNETLLRNPPNVPPRPFEADYPFGAQADAEGRLTHDTEGDPLVGGLIVGRRVAGGRDEALPAKEFHAIGKKLTGSDVKAVSSFEAGEGVYGFTLLDRDTGKPIGIQISSATPPKELAKVYRHELGHVIDDLAGQIPTKGLEGEFRLLYHDLQPEMADKTRLFGPERRGYQGEEIERELVAEAVRAAVTNPNYMKTTFPEIYARIREAVKKNPDLVKVIQFNTLAGGAIGLNQLMNMMENEKGAPDKRSELKSDQTPTGDLRKFSSLAQGAPGRPLAAQHSLAS